MLLLVEEGTYTEFRGYSQRIISLLSAAIGSAQESNPPRRTFSGGQAWRLL